MAAPDPPHKKICPGSCARNRSSLFIQDKQNKAYACSTLLARRHFVQTFILLTPPSALTLTLWTLEFQILLDLLCEWLTLFPKCAPLPQTSHFAIMTPPHVSKFRRQHTYTTRDILQMQDLILIFCILSCLIFLKSDSGKETLPKRRDQLLLAAYHSL